MKTHSAEELQDPATVFAAVWRRHERPLDLANIRSRTLTKADFDAATERGRKQMRGETDEENAGREVMRAIKEASAERKGVRTFPPARSLHKP